MLPNPLTGSPGQALGHRLYSFPEIKKPPRLLVTAFLIAVDAGLKPRLVHLVSGGVRRLGGMLSNSPRRIAVIRLAARMGFSRRQAAHQRLVHFILRVTVTGSVDGLPLEGSTDGA